MALKEHWRHIAHKSSCPPATELELYHAGKLPEEKRFEVENHLVDCEACNDYLEGLSVLPESVDLDEVENELKEKIQDLLDQKQKKRIIPIFYRRLGIAATLLLLVGTAFYFTLHDKEITPSENITSSENITPSEPSRIESGMTGTAEEKEVPAPQALPVQEEKASAIAQVRTDEFKQKQLSKKATMEADKSAEVTTTIEEDAEDVITMDIDVPSMEMAVPIKDEKNLSNAIRNRVNGIVIDESGQPMPGTAIYNPTSAAETVSDIDGHFTLAAKPGDSLQFSFIGFEKEARAVEDNDSMVVEMKSSAMALDEVAVVGYGVQKKFSLSGTVSGVNAKKQHRQAKRQETLKKLESNYQQLSASAKDDRANTLHSAEKYLTLKDQPMALGELKKLLLFARSNEEKETIRQTIALVEKKRYDKALKLLRTTK